MTLIAPTKIYRFASSSATGTVLSGLVVDKIEWHSFDLVDVYFSGSPTMTAVAAGHFLNITGATNTANIGRFLIVEKDPAAFRLRIKMTAAISHTSTYDEDPSPAEAVVENGGPALANLPPEKEALGFFWGEYPSADQLNSLLKNFGDWNYFFANGGAKAIQTAKVSVGRSTIATSTPTALGGEGRDVLPYSSSNIVQNLGSTSGFQTVNNSTINFNAQSGSRVLLGYSVSVDYNYVAAPTAATMIKSQLDTVDCHVGFVTNVSGAAQVAVSGFRYSSSASGAEQQFLLKASPQGTADLEFLSGKVWGIEIPSTADADDYTNTGISSNPSTTYAAIFSGSVTISPKNNPVLLIANITGFTSDAPATNSTYYKFTDGTNDYGEWRNAYIDGIYNTVPIAWVTTDLNGSKTFAVHFKAQAALSNLVEHFGLVAIEITGDSKRAVASGAPAVDDTDATVTDGVTDLSHTFTPSADIEYLAVFTGWLQRTAGTGFITLNIKSGATTLISIVHKRETSTDSKTPFTVLIPTGVLPADAAVTIAATAQTSDGSTTYTINNAALFLVEAPALTAKDDGNPSSATIENLKNGKIEVTYRSLRTCSADDELTLGLYKSEDGGAFSLLADSVITNPTPGTDAREVFYHHITDDIAEGTDVELELRASMATGSVIFEAGLLTAKELPSL